MDLPLRTSHASLDGLPAEIFIMIYEHLSPIAKATLSLTCRRFREEFAEDYFHILSQLPSSTDRWAFACLLEPDGLLNGRCCHDCLTVHPKSDFPSKELTKRPDEGPPRCWRTYPGLWLCPLGRHSFQAVHDKLKSWTNSEDPVYWTYLPGISAWSGGGRSNRFAILTSYTIIPPSNDPLPPKSWFVDFAKSFNIPLCPHLRLSDDLVVQQYDPKIFWHSGNGFYCFCPCKGTGNSRCPKCQYCDTLVHLSFQSEGTKGALRLQVERDVGALESPRDPKWRSQCVSYVDPALKSYWQAAFAWKALEMPMKYPDTGDWDLLKFQKVVASRNQKQFAEIRDSNDRDSFFHPMTGPNISCETAWPQNTTKGKIRNLCIWKGYFERDCKRMLLGR